jgi:deoxyribose-phosphate aldolase
MTPQEFARTIDHTILKPESLSHEVEKICDEAKEHKFASVCIAAAWVPHVMNSLRGTGVLTCTVAGFPHGTSKTSTKSLESISAIKDGAEEVDVVAHLPHLLTLNFDAARGELVEFVRASRAARRDVVLKVIVESAALLSILGDDKGEQAIEIACRAVRESGCDFIKTSTGFHPAGGASVKAISLMKKYGQSIKIKASGGIRDLATAQAMLDAGADRLGMSASVAVLKEFMATAGKGA